MKKYLALLCASMLCVCCLGLAACGSSASSSAASTNASDSAASASAASSEASASASAAAASSSAAAASPEELFTGVWNLAAMETQGVTMCGDLSMVLEDNNIVLTLNADGTANMAMGDESYDFTWKATGDTTAEATVNENTVPLSYEDGAVFMTMESDDFSGTVILTKDGTYTKLATVTAEGAKAITSEDALVGTWNLCALNMLGVSMYGEPEALAAVGGSTDTSITFEKGGKVTLMGEDATWTVDANGASIDDAGTAVPVQMLDNGNLVMDLSEMLGGMSMIMVFSK